MIRETVTAIWESNPDWSNIIYMNLTLVEDGAEAASGIITNIMWTISM
jgi:hypothetical protein